MRNIQNFEKQSPKINKHEASKFTNSQRNEQKTKKGITIISITKYDQENQKYLQRVEVNPRKCQKQQNTSIEEQKPNIIPPIIQKQDQQQNLFQKLKEDVELNEVRISAYCSFYISQLKKFYPETFMQKKDKKLIIPAQSYLSSLIAGFLMYITQSPNQQQLIKLKKIIIDCDFQRYIPKSQLVAEIFTKPNQFKAIILKTINLFWSEKSVYQIYLNYQIQMFLAFAFQCMILQHMKRNTYEPLQKQQIIIPFCQLLNLKSTTASSGHVLKLYPTEQKDKIIVLTQKNQEITVQLFDV